MKKLPVPFPDPELWNSNLEEGFRKFPERKDNYNKFRSSKRKKFLDYLPIQLDIENTNRCNYRCIMCQVGNRPKYARTKNMSFEEYKYIIESNPGLTEIKIQGLGEPFLDERLFEMIKYSRKKNIWVRCITNGSLLHLSENYKKALDADVCELHVSIDGASKETYEKIRRGGRFERVKENCILLNNYANKIGKKRTRMWAVLQENNFQELEAFPRLAEELGFNRFTIALNLNVWGGESYWKEANKKISAHKQFDMSKAECLIEQGKRRSVEVTFWWTYEKYDASDVNKLCPMPFQRLYVTSNMRLAPCCSMAEKKECNLGDARKITQEWNGSKMADFRNSHLTGRIPYFCRPCYKTP